MTDFARQVLQAETAAEIQAAARKASGIQRTDIEMCVRMLAETTDITDSGAGYMIEVLAELLLQANQAGKADNDYCMIA